MKNEEGKPGLKKNRKEDLNRVRGTQEIVDPERGPANKE